MADLLIKNATIVNEESTFTGHVLISGDTIAQVLHSDDACPPCSQTIDAQGAWLLPGVIDEHVHFREPGLTQKADISTESSAAAAGGVTSYFDMPNTSPTTTSVEAWEQKMQLMAEHSHVNYNAFFGATNNNAHLLPHLDKRRVCGVKLFMGASTGNMLVDRANALRDVFASSPLPIMAHCEDSPLISATAAEIKAQHGDDPDMRFHPIIRSEEACVRSSACAVQMAQEAGATLHIAHISTARELDFLSPDNPNIIGEACLPHLLFDDNDYARLGSRIKCNPSIKQRSDRDALRRALNDGRIRTIGTDHAPHLLKDKEGHALKATSGFPMIQFSLIAMLDLAAQGVLTRERVVRLMCHNPAEVYNISRRGYIREGYAADVVLVREEAWTLKPEHIKSKCGWSPLEGHTFGHRIWKTFCNGTEVYDAEKGTNAACRGRALTFDR